MLIPDSWRHLRKSLIEKEYVILQTTEVQSWLTVQNCTELYCCSVLKYKNIILQFRLSAWRLPESQVLKTVFYHRPFPTEKRREIITEELCSLYLCCVVIVTVILFSIVNKSPFQHWKELSQKCISQSTPLVDFSNYLLKYLLKNIWTNVRVASSIAFEDRLLNSLTWPLKG